MAMKNSYWDKRFLDLDKKVFESSEEYVREIRKVYDREIDRLNKEIYGHLTKLQDEAGNITLAEARKLLNIDELDLFKMNLEEFTKKAKGVITPEIEKELNIVSRRVRISRLQAMQVEIKKTVANLMSREEKGLFAHMGRTYEYKFYNELYGLQRIFGYRNIQRIDKDILKDIIYSPWASDGSNFSKRIWDRGDKLVNLLQDNLSRDIARGAAPDESIKNIARLMNTSKANAGRLVMTESAAINSRATRDSYSQMGTEQYQILATLDTRTSDICRSLDDKVYDVKDYRIGITAPPFHPNCRTTTVPYFDDEIQRRLDGTRMARNPETSKSERVENLSYKQWHDKYVKSNPKAVVKEKAWKNRHSDRKQYERYKNILGGEAPSRFDDFQKIKYNKVEEYKLYKLDYSRRNRLIEHPELKLPNVNSATIDDRKFTEYLFGGTNKDGLIKGQLITEKLGYNLDNYLDFKKEIMKRATINPSTFRGFIAQGNKFETRAIFRGKNNALINVEIGWFQKDDKTHMTSIYITEVKKSET